jgi:hypothetical protein
MKNPDRHRKYPQAQSIFRGTLFKDTSPSLSDAIPKLDHLVIPRTIAQNQSPGLVFKMKLSGFALFAGLTSSMGAQAVKVSE